MSNLLYEAAKAEQPFSSHEDVMEEAFTAVEYLSQFGDAYELWDEISEQGYEAGNCHLDDIYTGKSLDCHGRTKAVVLHEEVFQTGLDIDLLFQYDRRKSYWIETAEGSHVTPVIDGRPMDALNREENEKACVDRLPHIQTLSLAHDTFEKDRGNDIPTSYLEEQADRILEEEDQRPPEESSELMRTQAEAVKTAIRIDSLLGPLSRALDFL